MAPKIVDTLLPTTMVGSYPRPHGSRTSCAGRDVRVAFKEVQHEEAYNDAVATVIRDQEEAGLDIVTDWQHVVRRLRRIDRRVLLVHVRADPRLRAGREPHPSFSTRTPASARRCSTTGAASSTAAGLARPDPLRRSFHRGEEARQGPGQGVGGRCPINLAWHAYFNHSRPKELSYALAPIFNAEMKDLVAAGAKYLQIEDLGAWMPLFTGDKAYYTWIKDVIAQCCDGVNAKSAGLLFRQRMGQRSDQRRVPEAIRQCCRTSSIRRHQRVRARLRQPTHGRGRLLENLPKDKSVQVGVLDVRSNPSSRRRRSPTDQEDDRGGVARSRGVEHRLRHEAAGAHGGEDEARRARRGCGAGSQGSRRV